jgi:exonuclease III
MKKINSRIGAYWLMYLLLLPVLFITILPFVIKAQNSGTADAKSIIVGFYNFENYYDTTNQLNVADEEFLPNSPKQYNSVRFKNKSSQLASVIYGIGKINNANGISLLGIAEVENKMVLKKLADEPMIKKYTYQFIHFDSKDSRGIDVALMYQPAHFKPYQYRSYSLTDDTHFTTYATRDILYVQGELDKTWVHILVNHWPSRRGGENASAEKRFWAASVCKRIMDSIENRDPKAKFIVMGDFNDNPNNKSLKHLKMYNPFLKLFNRGLGSMAYRDSWSLFDQILLNANWRMEKEKTGHSSKNATTNPLFQPAVDNINSYNSTNTPPSAYSNFELIYCKSMIYRSSALTEQHGKYQGYPKRTWNGDQFNGGYSDHYPAVIIFKAKNDEKPLK